MSHIFDALLRSKTDPDVSPDQDLNVTSILQRAERQAALQRDAEIKASGASVNRAPKAELPELADAPDTSEDSGLHLLEDTTREQELKKMVDRFQTAAVSMPDENRLVVLSDPTSPAAEAFRLMGVRVRHLRRERKLKKLLLTSTAPQEGKSTIAANLACTLSAGAGRPVLLLDGDLRKPTLAKIFGLKASLGLSDYLKGQCEIEACIYHLEKAGIWLLPAGSSQESPLELLQAPRLQALMQVVEKLFDWIIVDSPPILPLADTSIWERYTDGVLLVVRQGITRRRKLEKGMEAIDQSKLICALLNSSRNNTVNDYYYYRDGAA